VWCRWVAMFVRDPAMLVRAVRDAPPAVALHSTNMCITKPMRFIQTERAWRSLCSWR
jgi:hypothetical protein